MEAPRKFDSICKHFSFVKPWSIDDKILCSWKFVLVVKCEKQPNEPLD